jgi:hypothetical protein
MERRSPPPADLRTAPAVQRSEPATDLEAASGGRIIYRSDAGDVGDQVSHLNIVQTKKLSDSQILAADLAMAVIGLVHPQVAHAQLFERQVILPAETMPCSKQSWESVCGLFET